MKHLLLSLLFVFSAVSAQESKVGTIDIDYILSLMPELSEVQEQVKAYQTELSDGYSEKLAQYEKALKDYRDNESLLTLMQKKSKEDSLVVMQNELGQYQQNGNQLLALRQEDFMQPLYTKVGQSLERVAEAGGYTQVLLRDNNVVYIDNRFDLTLAVLKELGIEVPKEQE
ncbi:OmpH family outer membrane protein [Flavobacteriaceae bacterium]|jgi:outer membrane protein|nr:OmpH family outer membrane protein [Flavobacteriaceae bacterium]